LVFQSSALIIQKVFSTSQLFFPRTRSQILKCGQKFVEHSHLSGFVWGALKFILENILKELHKPPCSYGEATALDFAP
jgi:hypothetical protein